MAEIQRNQAESKLLSAQQTLLTAEDLWKQPDDGYRYELVKGIIRRMPPAVFEHGIRSAKIGRHLDAHVEKHKLGYVCGAETGFKISQNPDTVRAPWVVNPRRETVEVYRSPEDMTVLHSDDLLDGGDVIEGFQCKVQELFV